MFKCYWNSDSSCWFFDDTQLKMWLKVSHSIVSDSLQPHELWNSLDQNTGVGSHSLLQGIFPTQGSNLGLLHCRQIPYQLSHKDSPCSNFWRLPIQKMLVSWKFWLIYQIQNQIYCLHSVLKMLKMDGLNRFILYLNYKWEQS